MEETAALDFPRRVNMTSERKVNWYPSPPAGCGMPRSSASAMPAGSRLSPAHAMPCRRNAKHHPN